MKRFIFLILLGFVLAACSDAPAVPVVDSKSSSAVLALADSNFTETPFQPATFTATVIPSQTPTLTPSATLSPTPTETPTPTLTPTWIFNEAGQVVAPILLYHHVEGEVSNSRYYVSIPDFRAQMQALYDWGYTAIPISLLLNALIDGAELPPKPIVITFDDGNRDIYDNAFPIMRDYDFPGVFYIVGNRVNSGTNITHAPELREMVEAGWEIGSHSYTHSDLTLDHSIARYEILQSKLDIEDAVGVEVSTFAYPFGLVDPYLAQKVSDYGYRAGMGLGTSWTHTWGSMFYLNRIEIHGDFSVDYMGSLLPWREE
ncbi:MAG: polysaccharide deacetylase family protein [Anaerolineales bacterium]|jgi:peptidoglycan/xylan/chitin deacetylase (PgdA/CDA1 family)